MIEIIFFDPQAMRKHQMKFSEKRKINQHFLENLQTVIIEKEGGRGPIWGEKTSFRS